jgi:hypothetical protein
MCEIRAECDGRVNDKNQRSIRRSRLQYCHKNMAQGTEYGPWNCSAHVELNKLPVKVSKLNFEAVSIS